VAQATAFHVRGVPTSEAYRLRRGLASATIGGVDTPGPSLPPDLSRLASLFDLSGQAALVTGAASGLGRAIAIGLARFGADVATADVNLAGAEETAAVARGLGRQAAAIEVDVTDWSSVLAMVEATVRALGRVDVGFNVPGINVRKPALEMTPDEFRRVVDVNLVGVFHCAKAIGARMVEQGGGRMVNIASMYGHVGVERSAAYTASKHGVVGLTQVLALEWAPHNVRVNAIAPGFTHTALTAPVIADRQRYEHLTSRTPLGRFAEPWEIVGAALFLVSDASTFVTGSSLIVDGGWTAQ
jgi:NAD(P)-dependent dehydrogenase (short-subunit alcohol dehydrogenase family)